MIPNIAFVGYKNTGKTTLLCKVIESLRDKGLRIGTIKHDGHDFEMDHPDTDTYLFRQAGSNTVMIQSASKLATIETTEHPIPLEALITRYTDVDIILIEGYKWEPIPKILLARTKQQLELLDQLENIQALCIDPILFTEVSPQWQVPVFEWNDAVPICDFVYGWWEKNKVNECQNQSR